MLKSSASFKVANQTCSWMSLFLACPTVLLNIAMIVAFMTSRNRLQPCQMLLVNLAVTDLLTGIFNMPAFFVIFRFVAEMKDPCRLLEPCMAVLIILGCVSFITIAFIAFERYLSVFHPYSHASKLSARNVAICVTIVWIVPILLITLSVTGLFRQVISTFIAAILVTGTSFNFYSYLRILLQARKIRLQIHSEAARLGQTDTGVTDKRYIFIGGLIIISMLTCFAPLGVNIILRSTGFKTNAMEDMRCFEWTLAMANSLVNPIITCIFCPPIRAKVLRIMTCNSCNKVRQQDAVTDNVTFKN